MKKLFVWIIRIAVLVLLAKIVMWSWQQYHSGGAKGALDGVSDFDKMCHVTNPDTLSCVCIHRQTRERLSVPHDECVRRARDPNAI
jgi:hypothetical protein